MNEILEAKLSIAKIKVKVLDLAGALAADETTDKDYAITKLLEIVEYIEKEDIRPQDLSTKKAPYLAP